MSSGFAAQIVSWEALNRDIEDCKTVKNRIKANALRGVMTGWPNSGPDLFLNTGILQARQDDRPVRADGPRTNHLQIH